MMVDLLIYAYARGQRASRHIERSCIEDVAPRPAFVRRAERKRRAETLVAQISSNSPSNRNGLRPTLQINTGRGLYSSRMYPANHGRSGVPSVAHSPSGAVIDCTHWPLSFGSVRVVSVQWSAYGSQRRAVAGVPGK